MNLNERIGFIAENFFSGHTSEMAQVVYVKQTTLDNIIRGDEDPSLDILTSIIRSSKLRVSPMWLLTGEGDIQEPDQRLQISAIDFAKVADACETLGAYSKVIIDRLAQLEEKIDPKKG